ncbi:MAG: beta-glucosidase, partial [Bacteroidales bacterium]|nr:beta-glucosidase [Bacteroidales bacterium]
MDSRIIMSTITAAILTASSSCNQTPPQLGTASIDEVIAAMTIEEKALMLIGAGMDPSQEKTSFVGSTEQKVPGAAGITRAIPRLGIPSIVLADGPAGLRIKPKRDNDENTYYCTAFPIATTLSSTWNTELVKEVGESIGNEVLEYGVDVILSPGANIHRNPLCGRNYEYYSEDPVLAGKTASALINGIQSLGVGTSIKHFAGNSQETNRMNNDARITQRALREIYLRQFQIAIRESNPWTVMTSYNFINGSYSSENRELVHDILRDEWKYDGLVMTDWFAGTNPVNQVISGNDLLMPGVNNQYEKIVEGIKNGSLKIEYVDENVKRILELVLKSPTFKKYQYSNKPNLEEHAKITRQAASEGIVLLTNKNNALPIKGGKAALFGVTSYTFYSGGTGSGDVNEAYTVSLCEGLENQGFTIDEKLKTSIFQQSTNSARILNLIPQTRMAWC